MPGPDYWTPEKREEQRQRALKLKEEGRWGGSVGGQASSEARRRATGSLSERIEDPENLDDMWEALMAGLSKNQPVTTRLRTVNQMIEIAERERKTIQEERRAVERQSREELLGSLAGELIKAIGRGINPMDLDGTPEIIDGEARELTDGVDGEEGEAWSPE